MNKINIIWKILLNVVVTFVIFKILQSGTTSFEQIVLASLVILYTYITGFTSATPRIFQTLALTLGQDIIDLKKLINKKADYSADEEYIKEEQNKQKNQLQIMLIVDGIFRAVWFLFAILSIISA